MAFPDKSTVGLSRIFRRSSPGWLPPIAIVSRIHLRGVVFGPLLPQADRETHGVLYLWWASQLIYVLAPYTEPTNQPCQKCNSISPYIFGKNACLVKPCHVWVAKISPWAPPTCASIRRSIRRLLAVTGGCGGCRQPGRRPCQKPTGPPRALCNSVSPARLRPW